MYHSFNSFVNYIVIDSDIITIVRISRGRHLFFLFGITYAINTGIFEESKTQPALPLFFIHSSSSCYTLGLFKGCLVLTKKIDTHTDTTKQKANKLMLNNGVL